MVAASDPIEVPLEIPNIRRGVATPPSHVRKVHAHNSVMMLMPWRRDRKLRPIDELRFIYEK
jgi:hypothetical protein